MIPPVHDWRTTDEDEINRRRLRAREERFAIENLEPGFPVFGNFSVRSGSGQTYAVELRGLGRGECACTCVDFRSNALGTCKHGEAVWLHLARRERPALAEARRLGRARRVLVVTPASLKAEWEEQSQRFTDLPVHLVYDGQEVMKLANVAERRPLTEREQERLQRELAMMRMICDTNYILDPGDRECPKLAELEGILDDCLANGAKAIVFSEWERMLELVRELCQRQHAGFAWHTGSVPQQHRRGQINRFKNDPDCRVFLTTDAGATGLNLQDASVVVNCDLPWNPARLRRRAAPQGWGRCRDGGRHSVGAAGRG